LSGTITLALGQLTIADDNTSGPDLTIHGPGGSGLAVSGNNISRVFLINSAADVTIDGLTISSGRTGITGIGGGIYNGGTLRLSHSTVSGNTGGQAGGGIISSGTLTLENSTVSGNTNTDIGGGIFNDNGTLTLINSTVSGNTSDTDSGGIHNEGTMTLENSTVSANEAAGAGGGITNSGTAKLTNTIVARNTATTNPDVSGTLSFSSQGNNLIGDTSGTSGWSASDLLRQDPLLGPLQNNGGPTKTHALLPGSPAIDRAANSACLFTDQRGVQRKDGNGDGTVICDIGAFEAPTNTRPTITNPIPTPGSNTRDRTPSIAATVSDAQTNLAKTNIKLFVDGNRKTTFSYDRSTDSLSYTSGRLAFGKHTVKVLANDGVLSTIRSWSFKVVRG